MAISFRKSITAILLVVLCLCFGVSSVIAEQPETITNSIGMPLKLLLSGNFTMGDGSNAHKVTLTQPFMLGVHEVTQAQYEQVMGSNPSKFRGPQNPVETVSWNDALDFCQKLSALPEELKAGRVYRLPTEAEWEYACRAGTTTKYSFGDDESQLGEYAWFVGNAGRETRPVGLKQPNAWGLYDMHGNVWEWCADWYGGYPSGYVTDPTGPQSGSYRVIRGGSWGTYFRPPASRDWDGPYRSYDDLGFRVACVPSGQ